MGTMHRYRYYFLTAATQFQKSLKLGDGIFRDDVIDCYLSSDKYSLNFLTSNEYIS